jgi:hypothetical protein
VLNYNRNIPWIYVGTTTGEYDPRILSITMHATDSPLSEYPCLSLSGRNKWTKRDTVWNEI